MVVDKMKYSHIELQRCLKEFEAHEQEIANSLDSIRKKIKGIKYTLNQNDEGLQEWMVSIPVHYIVQDFKKELQTKWNWKKIVMELFAKYKQPMTTEILFSKYLISYSNPVCERLFVIRNISAAAHYLVNDGKLIKVKIGKSKSYVYCTRDQVDESGNLKEIHKSSYEQQK
jgi:hypothetical protein